VCHTFHGTIKPVWVYWERVLADCVECRSLRVCRVRVDTDKGSTLFTVGNLRDCFGWLTEVLAVVSNIYRLVLQYFDEENSI